MRPQVIDVPVRPLRRPLVMRQSRPQTAGTEGTADVHVPAAPERQIAQLPDTQAAGVSRSEDEGIGTLVLSRAASCVFSGYSESNTSFATRTALAAVGHPA